MTSKAALLEQFYQAFNARDVETVLAALHPEVDWPNGWEGGRVVGREAVRDYWARQWAVLDPTVTPLAVTESLDGRVTVRVHQLVRDRAGAILFDGEVQHVYTFDGEAVRAMDIE